MSAMCYVRKGSGVELDTAVEICRCLGFQQLRAQSDGTISGCLRCTRWWFSRRSYCRWRCCVAGYHSSRYVDCRSVMRDVMLKARIQRL